MRFNKILTTLALFSSVSLVNAQDGQTSTTTFWDIVFGGDAITALIFLSILSLVFIAIPLGLTSIVQCFNKNRISLPLSSKLIMCFGLSSLLLGLLGIITGIVGYFAAIGSMEGVAKTTAITMYISTSLYSGALGIFGSLFYMFFLILTFIVFHTVRRKLPRENF